MDDADTSTEVEEVDLLIIGGGKAGKSLAMDRAQAGWSVAMVERDKIGGTCINVACIPTKSLIESARTLIDAQSAADMGIAIDGTPTVSLELLRQHKESVVGGMVETHEEMFANSGMDFILGTAHFIAEQTVCVDVNDGTSRVIRGNNVVINTGTTPQLPDIDGVNESTVWTSESILHLERIPASLVVVGGGYVGCEFAAMFAAFGTEVTLAHGGDRLLNREDPDIAEEVRELLSAQGVTVQLSARANRVERTSPQEDDKRSATVHFEDGSTVVADEVLVATGRAPVTSALHLDAAGVDIDERGFINVDEQLKTTSPNTWAAGDITGGPQFTHLSWHDFRVLRENLTGGSTTTSDRLVPYTVFITPELARVGLNETEARDQGHNIRVATLPVAKIPRAKTVRRTEGVWKAIVDADTGLILGATLLGHNAGEVITTVQMAMLANMTYQQLRDAIITHPTMGEGLNLLFDALEPASSSNE